MKRREVTGTVLDVSGPPVGTNEIHVAKDWLKESVIGECEERDDFRVFDAEYLNVPSKEKDLQKCIIDLGLARGWGCIRINQMSRGFYSAARYYGCGSDSKGIADLLFVRPGALMFVECKRNPQAKSNRKTEDAQEAFWAWCTFFGAEYHRVTSLEQAKTILTVRRQK